MRDYMRYHNAFFRFRLTAPWLESEREVVAALDKIGKELSAHEEIDLASVLFCLVAPCTMRGEYYTCVRAGRIIEHHSGYDNDLTSFAVLTLGTVIWHVYRELDPTPIIRILITHVHKDIKQNLLCAMVGYVLLRIFAPSFNEPEALVFSKVPVDGKTTVKEDYSTPSGTTFKECCEVLATMRLLDDTTMKKCLDVIVNKALSV